MTQPQTPPQIHEHALFASLGTYARSLLLEIQRAGLNPHIGDHNGNSIDVVFDTRGRDNAYYGGITIGTRSGKILRASISSSPRGCPGTGNHTGARAVASALREVIAHRAGRDDTRMAAARAAATAVRGAMTQRTINRADNAR